MAIFWDRNVTLNLQRYDHTNLRNPRKETSFFDNVEFNQLEEINTETTTSLLCSRSKQLLDFVVIGEGNILRGKSL